MTSTLSASSQEPKTMTATLLEPTADWRLMTCSVCDGLGEWDEGPLLASSGATEPEYRQVICTKCDGTGLALVECEPRTLDDLNDEIMEQAEVGP